MLTALLIVAIAAAPSCKFAYGAVADLDRCATATLPGFEVRFTGYTQPNPNVPLSCRNYEARRGGETATFKQCSTGVLGGAAAFTLGAKTYIVVFDVGDGCAKTRGGNFAPAVRGHVFFDREPRADFRQKRSKREAACYDRKR